MRSMRLTCSSSVIGLIVTNTVSQGDTRELGLDQLGSYGSKMIRADQNFPWPGSAVVVVHLLWIAKDTWHGDILLDGRKVPTISPTLEEGFDTHDAVYRLDQNKNISFKGTTTGCVGFVIEKNERDSLLTQNPLAIDVIQPFLGGGEFTTVAILEPQRWVINFRDWPLERAETFPECLKVLEDRVKPYFDARTGQIHEPDYWKFSDKRLDSYDQIKSLKKVLFHAFTAKYVAFDYVPVGWVYSAPHVVVGLEDKQFFSVLQSSIHIEWVHFRCSTIMKSGIRYAPSDLFDTFPFPLSLTSDWGPQKDVLAELGERYLQLRNQIRVARNIGLTETYNLFHENAFEVPDIFQLRELHRCMDHAVLVFYGWTDLQLEHGFHKTKHGVRYTISEAARREVLARLLALNHQRHAEEEAEQAAQPAAKPAKRGRKPKDTDKQVLMDL